MARITNFADLFHNPLTHGDLQTVIQLLRQGYSLEQLAKGIGYGEEDLRQKLKEAKLEIPASAQTDPAQTKAPNNPPPKHHDKSQGRQRQPKEPKQPAPEENFVGRLSRYGEAALEHLLDDFGMVGRFASESILGERKRGSRHRQNRKDAEPSQTGIPEEKEHLTLAPDEIAELKKAGDSINEKFDRLVSVVEKGLVSVATKIELLGSRVATALEGFTNETEVEAETATRTPADDSGEQEGKHSPFGGIIGGMLGLGALKDTLMNPGMKRAGLVGGLITGGLGLLGAMSMGGGSGGEDAGVAGTPTAAQPKADDKQQENRQIAPVLTIKARELEFNSDSIEFQANSIVMPVGSNIMGGAATANTTQAKAPGLPSPVHGDEAQGTAASPTPEESPDGGPPPTQPVDISGGQIAGMGGGGGAGGGVPSVDAGGGGGGGGSGPSPGSPGGASPASPSGSGATAGPDLEASGNPYPPAASAPQGPDLEASGGPIPAPQGPDLEASGGPLPSNDPSFSPSGQGDMDFRPSRSDAIFGVGGGYGGDISQFTPSTGSWVSKVPVSSGRGNPEFQFDQLGNAPAGPTRPDPEVTNEPPSKISSFDAIEPTQSNPLVGLSEAQSLSAFTKSPMIDQDSISTRLPTPSPQTPATGPRSDSGLDRGGADYLKPMPTRPDRDHIQKGEFPGVGKATTASVSAYG